MFAALPASLVTALLYGVLVFLVAGAVYVLTDTVSLPPADAARWRTAVVLYAAYAATFGVLIGLWRPVVRPALGI